MINEIQNSFNKNGYVVIRKHLPENFADILYFFPATEHHLPKPKL